MGAKYRPHGVYRDARSILVIHNLSHQVSIYLLHSILVYFSFVHDWFICLPSINNSVIVREWSQQQPFKV